MLADLGAKGITKTVYDRVDSKAWAKRILEREERGDKTLLSIQVKFAKMALDIKDEVHA